MTANITLAAIGYVGAVFVSTNVCAVIMTVQEALAPSTGSAPPEFFYYPVILLAVGMPLTGATAWPGFVLTLLVGARHGIDHPAYFLVAGIATAIFAVALCGLLGAEREIMANLLFQNFFVYAGGAAGGLVYGLYARKLSVFLPR
ncbi:hypothetical protein [Roseibium polysiphoniae]|uniref:Uncharacterized protein n=1 Tax=Roseibium polysiphoniae TaxID=2571221 RepID=A0ABR9CBK7_9HYPH|nr:hypothetical protein [Roseibium polysiphoniae]MBD8877291.1 hypothetical protein [Roseibium polysiphoniae]